MKSKVAVIGFAGFIGSTLTDRLVELGYNVIGIDDLSTGKRENINEDIGEYYLNLDVSNPRNQDRLVEIFKRVDIVFHLAAWARVVRSVEDPMGTNKVNVGGTLGVLEAMRKAGKKNLVFSSSSSVYGDQKVAQMVEGMDMNPKSPYALQKLMGELYISLYAKNYGIRGVCLRYFNVYGPRQVTKGEYSLVIGKFMAKKAKKEKLTIYGDGKQTRAYTHVSDVVEANIKAMDYFKSNHAKVVYGTQGFISIFNIGTNIETSVNKVAKLIGGEVEHIIPNPRGDFEEQRKSANFRRAKVILGWEPKIEIEEGINDLL